MRLSALPGHADYNDALAQDHFVTLNGRVLRSCHTADEERGIAEVWMIPDDPGVVPYSVTYVGVVRIRPIIRPVLPERPLLYYRAQRLPYGMLCWEPSQS